MVQERTTPPCDDGQKGVPHQRMRQPRNPGGFMRFSPSNRSPRTWDTTLQSEVYPPNMASEKRSLREQLGKTRRWGGLTLRDTWVQEPLFVPQKNNDYMAVAQNETGGANRGFWSMFPLTRVPCWYRFFKPQPHELKEDAQVPTKFRE